MDKLINDVLSYEATKSKWRNNYNSNEWKQANKLNGKLFKMPLNQSAGCQCLEDLFFYIKRVNFKENLKIMSNKQFKIKEGKLLLTHGFPPMSNNTPDEDFIKMLKMNPALINALESYPKNWKEIVFGESVKAVVNASIKIGTTKADALRVDNSEGEKVEPIKAEKELSDMSLAELKEVCESKGIKFHHKSKEAKLIELINNAL